MWTSRSSVGAPAQASPHRVELRLIDSCHITQKSIRVSALQGHEFNFFAAGSLGFPTQFGPFKVGRRAFKYFFLTAPERNYLLCVDNWCCQHSGRRGGKIKLLHWFHARGQFQLFVEAFRLSADILADAFIMAGAERRDSSGRSVVINTPRFSLGIFGMTQTERAITYANLIKRAINHAKCTNYSFVTAWLAAASQAEISWVTLMARKLNLSSHMMIFHLY